MLHGHQPHVAPKLRNVAAVADGPVEAAHILTVWPAHWGPGCRGPNRAAMSGPNDYPGQRLGLPETGSGSIARFGRRIAALLIDWFIAYGLVGLAVALGLISQQNFLYTPMGSTAIAVVWVVLGIVSVRLFGFTPGQLALGFARRVGGQPDSRRDRPCDRAGDAGVLRHPGPVHRQRSARLSGPLHEHRRGRR